MNRHSLTPHRYESKPRFCKMGHILQSLYLSTTVLCLCEWKTSSCVIIHQRQDFSLIASVSLMKQELSNYSTGLAIVFFWHGGERKRQIFNSQDGILSQKNSSCVVVILPQCPVCLVHRRFQSEHKDLVWTQTRHSPLGRDNPQTDSEVDAHIQMRVCPVEWFWALRFKAMPVKERRQLCAAVL